MTEQLVKNWNNVVGKDDLVWHLGDFALGGKQHETIPNIRSRLNGRINLVLGNHDNHSMKFYYDAGFDKVYDKPIITNEFIILSHQPIEFLNDNCPFFNVYGHVHDDKRYQTISDNGVCACVERWNYTPVDFEKLKEIVENFTKTKMAR